MTANDLNTFPPRAHPHIIHSHDGAPLCVYIQPATPSERVAINRNRTCSTAQREIDGADRPWGLALQAWMCVLDCPLADAAVTALTIHQSEVRGWTTPWNTKARKDGGESQKLIWITRNNSSQAVNTSEVPGREGGKKHNPPPLKIFVESTNRTRPLNSNKGINISERKKKPKSEH